MGSIQSFLEDFMELEFLLFKCFVKKNFYVEVYREGKKYYQTYSRGKPITELKEEPINSDITGTFIKFKPDDEEIFEKIEFDYEIIRERLLTLSFLNKGVKLF